MINSALEEKLARITTLAEEISEVYRHDELKSKLDDPEVQHWLKGLRATNRAPYKRFHEHIRGR